MENLVHGYKLQMSEVKMTNQDLTEKVRTLQIRIEELKVEAEMERVGEMAVKIQELITQTGKYKSDYLRALQESQDLAAQLKASQSTISNLLRHVACLNPF